MITFRLNKLVRDGLLEFYDGLGETYELRVVEGDEHRELLVQKMHEEITELEAVEAHDDVVKELADIAQVREDLIALGNMAVTALQISIDAAINEADEQTVAYQEKHSITDKEIMAEKQRIFDKKGGFAGGNFVLTLTLQAGDSWIGYYRKEPEKFPEISR